MKSLKNAIGGNDIVKVLQIRSFSFLMIAEFFTQLAFNMQHFVLIFLIYEITKSNTAVSGIILSFSIPAVLFSLISGVYVDRWNKKWVLIAANFLRGVFILPFLISDLHLGFIYTFTFFISVATQFFIPAESAIIPLLVPKKLMIAANAIFGIGMYATILLGYILSGPALLLFGRITTVFILAALFFVSTIFVIFVKLREKDKISVGDLNVSSSVSYEVKEIFTFIRKARKVMHALIVVTISQAVVFMFGVLGPGYMSKILGVEIESLSWILLAPAAVGMALGGFLLGSYGKNHESRFLSSTGFFISGIVFILLPLGKRVSSANLSQDVNAYLPHLLHVNTLHIVVFLAFIAGFANSLIFIPSNTTLQLETSEKMRGRIFGFLNALVGAVSLIPVAMAGGLADIIGVGSVISIVGVILVILSVMFLIFD